MMPGFDGIGEEQRIDELPKVLSPSEEYARLVGEEGLDHKTASLLSGLPADETIPDSTLEEEKGKDEPVKGEVIENKDDKKEK